MIPEAAVEAAMIAWLDRSKAPGSWSSEEDVRAALEAAAPHMLARHEAALEAVSKALSDAEAFGRQATHHQVMEAMRSELTP